MLILLYRTFYLITAPFVLFYCLLFSKKMRQFMFSREKNLKKCFKTTYWIHVSSGEYEHARPMIKKLKEKEPSTKVVVSYSSPSYITPIKNTPEVDYYVPYPLDLKGPISSLIRTINPKAVLFSRTDLWPEIIHQLKRKNIPSLLFARHESGSKSLFKKLSALLTYKKLSHISFVSKKDEEIFQDICPHSHTSVDGDPRVEGVFERIKNNERVQASPTPLPFENSLILGSVWKEDIDTLAEPLLNLLEKKHLSKILIAPHELKESFLKDIESRFSDFNIKRYSEDPELESSVILLDRMGLLLEMYSRFEMAFVGGSFKSKVHSVLEPLAQGLPVIVGPYYKNSFEAQKYSRNENGKFVRTVKDKEMFTKEVLNLLSNEVQKEDLISNLKEQKDASERIYHRLSELVKS